MSNKQYQINMSPEAHFELEMAVLEIRTLAKVLCKCGKPFYANELLRIEEAMLSKFVAEWQTGCFC